MSRPSLVDYIVATLNRRGVKRMFGIPGGGSSLDVIDAGARAGIDFVLARTETAAAFMAAVTAELTGAPGVVLTGIGPGAASAVNGIAYAALEKAPVVLISDCRGAGSSLHQAFDQRALYSPLVKAGCRLMAETAGDFDQLLDLALTRPLGPVHVDLASSDAARPVASSASPARSPEPGVVGDVDAAGRLLAASRRPIIIAGLDARSAAGATGLSRLADGLHAPVLATYKAKGVFPDADPRMIGLFTGARAEAASLEAADLIILYGLDPVEVIPGPWSYAAPLLELAVTPGHRHPVEPAVTLCGPFGDIVEALRPSLRNSAWDPGEVAGLRQRMRERLSLAGRGHNAQTVTEAVQRAAPAGTRLCVDSGAHMFAAMAFWQAAEPLSVLKSNGLSSMGFAVPAAIASALADPPVPVAALTGDGGMMMCLGELATAAESQAKIVCVVLNDAALSLIDIKQRRAQRPSLGVRYPPTDFAAVAKAMGCLGWQVGLDDDLDGALAEAFACDGPAVLDVLVDASGYAAQLEALRG